MAKVNESNISQQMPTDDEDYCAIADILIDCNKSVYDKYEESQGVLKKEYFASGDFPRNGGSPKNGDYLDIGSSYKNDNLPKNGGSNKNGDSPENSISLEIGSSHENDISPKNGGLNKNGDSLENDISLEIRSSHENGDSPENRGPHEHGDPHKNRQSCESVALPDNYSSASQPGLCKVRIVVITLVVLAFIMIIIIAAVKFVRSEATQKNLTTSVTYHSKGKASIFLCYFPSSFSVQNDSVSVHS